MKRSLEVTMEGEAHHSDKVVRIIKCYFVIYRIIDFKIIITVIKFEFAFRQCFSSSISEVRD